MKFTLKRIIAAALSALGIASVAGAVGCAKKVTNVAVPVNAVITKTDAPTDGSLPTAHSGAENLAYIAKTLEEQEQFHSYSYTLTNASIATQITRGYRDFKDGVLISSDITYSSMVKSGTQTCTVFNEESGEWEVYARASAEPVSTTTATNAEWSNDAPTYYSQSAYYNTYGLFQTELTNFIINDESILECGEVGVNPDGTYTQSFILDPVAATYYYGVGMKTRGGLGDYPQFQNVTLTVTFTDKWLPLSVVSHDVSTVNKGVVVTSTSDSTCEFYYGESDFDGEHFGFYRSYFAGYLGDDTLEKGGEIDEELVLDVTNVLSNGFAKIMDGGEQFELDLSLGKNKYKGYVFVALDLADPLETLDIKLSMGKSFNEQNFYVEYKDGEASVYYGKDFAADVNIAALKPVISEITAWADDLKTALSGAVSAANDLVEGNAAEGEGSDALAGLMGCMTLETKENEATLSLVTDDLLGLGIGVDVRMYFGVGSKSVTFRGATVNGLSVGGNDLGLDVKIRATTAEFISREKTDANADIAEYVSDVFSLISSDLIKVELKLDGDGEGVNVSALKGLKADVTAYVDIDGVTAYAEADVSYNYMGNNLSVSAGILYDYDVNSEGYGTAVVTLNSINGAPCFVQVGCDVADILDALKTVITFSGVPAGGAADGVACMLNRALTYNCSSLLTEVYSDRMQIKLGVNVDTVLALLGVDTDIKFGSCTLMYKRGDGVYSGALSAELPAIGFGMTVSGESGGIPEVDTSNCLDLVYAVEDITKFIQADLYEVNLSVDGAALSEGVNISALKDLTADVTVYADVKGLAVYAEADIKYVYNGQAVSAKLNAWYNYDKDTNGTVVLNLVELNGKVVNVTVSAEINRTVEAVKQLLTYCNVQLDMPKLGGEVKLDEVLGNVLAADLETLLPTLNTSADGLALGVNADEALKLFNVDLGLSIGVVNLAYSHANCNLVANVPAFGLGVTVGVSEDKIPEADTSNCLDLVYAIEDITKFIQADLYEVNLSVDGAALSEGVNVSALKDLTADVTVYADVKGLAVYAEVAVGYVYNNRQINAKLSAWYDYDKDTNGTVVLNLASLNGKVVNVTVSAEINRTVEAVKQLLTYCNVQLDMPKLGGEVKLDEVLGNVLAADLETLLPTLNTSADGLALGVNADEALKLFNVDLSLSIGVVNLAYSHANCNLVANVPAFGLGVTVGVSEDKIPEADTSNALDLVYAVEDVTKFIQADLYEVTLSVDGVALSEGVNISALKDLTADVTVYADVKGLAVYAEVAVGYVYNNRQINVKLNAWYDYDKDTNGTVVLNLAELNGKIVNVTVSAEINRTVEAVRQLLTYCNVQLDMPKLGGEVKLDEVLGNVLAADLETLLPTLKTSADGLALGVNADEALKLFNLDLGLSLGVVNLAYSHANCNLVANVPAFGLGVTVGVSEDKIPEIDTSNCLDLAKLVELINDAWAQVDGFINDEAVAFNISQSQTYLYLDGLTVCLWGNGEVSWKAGGEYVALDLAMSIEESGNNAGDVTRLKLIYQKNVEGAPLVRLALNDIAVDIYPEDIESLKEGLGEILDKLAVVLGDVKTEGIGGGNNFALDLKGDDKLIPLIIGVIADGDWIDVLNSMTLTCAEETDGGNVVSRSLLWRYATDNAAEIKFTSQSGLELIYDAAIASGFRFGGGVKVNKADGNLRASLDYQFGNMDVHSSKKDGTQGFVKEVYDFLFEAISSVTVENILGSDTYAVTFCLDGDNCNIEALKGVYVSAELYITGAGENRGKVAEGDLKITVDDVAVDLNVITERVNGQTVFYINLRQVMNFKLPDLKVMATQGSLYETVDVLLSAITDTNAMSFIKSFLPAADGGGELPADGEEITVKEGTSIKLSAIIEKALDFKFDDAFKANRTGDVTEAELDLDNVVKQLGFGTGELGTVKVNINHKRHSMKTSGTASVADAAGVVSTKEWIYLSSEKADARDYGGLDKSKYISIEFIPSILKDAIKFATNDDGEIYDMFTLSGTVNINLVKIITVELDISTLTVGIDSEKGFYFSLIANLKGGLVSNDTIGMTYQNGYLTLGRKLATTSPEYKIMTFEYFVDNMFAKGSASTLNWLLGVSDVIWNMVVSGMGDLVKMDSGLTTPEEIYLYKKQEVAEDREISMYDYVNALRVIVNGRQTALIGDPSELESKLGVSDNYYGFDLNSSLFTNGTITKLFAAITRTDETGLCGVKAYGEIQSYVTFTASLDYAEGLTENDYYKVGTGVALTKGVSAPSLYDEATVLAAAANVKIDFDHFANLPEKGYDEKFGCFSTANMKNEYSHMLYSHTLKIVALDGTVTERSVRHGSTVYTYDNASPVYVGGDRLLYSLNENGETLGASVTVNGDMTIYEITRKAVNIVIANGKGEEIITSFEGDSVPVNIDGLDTIDGPYYYANNAAVQEGDRVPAGISVLKLYGVFVKREVVVNYVKYTFDVSTKSYVVSGKAAGFADKYSTNGETLVLENTIGDYKVTSIAAGAFANVDGKPIVSVIVPENIIYVGEQAFLNNYGMKSAVFLADKVTFYGKDGSDKTMPFYGCSRSESDEKVGGVKQNEVTDLVVYYNTIVADGGNWRHFRYVYNGWWYNFYIGDNGGALRSDGWSMVNKYVVGADLVTEEKISDYIDVIAADGLKSDGSFTLADAAVIKSALTERLSGYLNEWNEAKYVVNVSWVELGAKSGDLVIKISLNTPKLVTLYSEIDMSYTVGNRVQSISGGAAVTVNTVGDDGVLELYAPEAVDSGYVFLGWAEERADGGMEFVEYGEENSDTVYFAVWGYSKAGQKVTASVNTYGSEITAPTSGDGKWYDGGWNEVTTISKANTVVYTRSVFSFNYTVSGKAAMKISDSLHGVSKKDMDLGAGYKYSNSFEVMEGQTVKIVRTGDKEVVIYVDGEVRTTLTLSKWNLNNKSFASDVGSENTVNSDVGVTISYK